MKRLMFEFSDKHTQPSMVLLKQPKKVFTQEKFSYPFLFAQFIASNMANFILENTERNVLFFAFEIFFQ